MAKKLTLRGESEHSIQVRILKSLGAQSSAVREGKDGQKLVKINLYLHPSGMFWRNNSGVGKTDYGARISFGCPGSGDILGVFKGRPIAIEVKTETGRQSQAQKTWQQSWEACGGIYILARSPGEVWERLDSIA